MAEVTLKALHTYLRFFENPSELKRKMPGSYSQRTLKEGLLEMSKLLGIAPAVFNDSQNIAALIGPPRFVMIWGEPSVNAHVARIFDSAKVLWTVLIDPGHFEKPTPAQSATHSAPAQPLPAKMSWPPSHPPLSGANAQPNAAQEHLLQNLNPLLAENMDLTCRLFRVIFEHMLGFASQSSIHHDSVALVNELVAGREHGRCMLATVLFLLGVEVDRENLMSFLLEHYLFGLPIFEHLLLNRDYCAAYYTFRRLERAFVASPAEEEQQLRSRMDSFNAQFEGKPETTNILEADDPNYSKAKIDAHHAAVDLLEAMALTPLSITLSQSLAASPFNCVSSMKTIAQHFERFATRQQTKEQANHEIAEHLLAFARQFSADR